MSGLRGTSPEQPASLPDNQDMLWEILLRLPQDLYSLHRASAVCKQWRGILVDPRFLCLFHAHHRKPPLLGFFHYSSKQIVFKPVLAPPDCITPGRFSLGHYSNHILLDSRHGRVLVKGLQLGEVAVCDPITSKHHRVSIPPEFNGRLFKAAVLCAASNQGHVHGGCHLCPFKVVLVMIYSEGQPIASVYSSETATWSGLISTEPPHDGCFLNGRGTLVGNVLYWPLNMRGHNILEFDLDTQNLTVIKGPPDMHMIDLHNFHIIEAEDGAVGLAGVSCLKLLLWQRKIDCQGIPIWFLWKTISWRKLLKITKKRQWLKVVGFCRYLYQATNKFDGFVFSRCSSKKSDLIFLHETGFASATHAVHSFGPYIALAEIKRRLKFQRAGLKFQLNFFPGRLRLRLLQVYSCSLICNGPYVPKESTFSQ
uniref:F-box protein AT5G49610-like beta-propeller domain-containing protein n=1 Tax=Aegilops tauschii TaxID=37682 RepID=M8D9H4_AEGTA